MTEFNRRQYYRRKSRIMKLKRKVALAKKRIRRFRMFIRVFLICMFLYSSYYLLNLRSWYLNPEDIMNLNPEIVKIEGNLITPKYKISDIIRTSEIPNEQIFKFSTKELENNLSKLQSVKKAYVRRFFFPARIIVIIEERVPVFLISPNIESQPISAVTIDGHFIDREYMPIPTKFKTTRILSYGTDDNYENWDKKKVDELLRFIKTVETYSKQSVQYLDLRNKNDIYVKLEDVLLRIGTLDDTTDDRIKTIPTILPEALSLKQQVKYIDLRWRESSYIKLDTTPEKVFDKTEE